MGKQRPVTSFEVYVLQGGKWELHARYAREERNAAIHDAKELDKLGHIGSVKVVKDVYDPNEGTSREVTVYRSSKGRIELAPPKTRGVVLPGEDKTRRARGVIIQGRGGRHAHGGGEAPTGAGGDGGPGRRSRLGLISKLILITLFSVAVAAILTGLASFLIREVDMLARWVGSERYAAVLLVVFALGVLFTGVPMASVFITRDDLAAASSPRREPRSPAREPEPETETEPPAGETDGELLASETAYAAATAHDGPQPEPGGTDLAAVIAADAAEQAAGTPPRSTAGTGSAPAAPASGAPPPPPPPPVGEDERRTVMAFVRDALAEVHRARPRLDHFNKFGITLYLAGACELLAQERRLNRLALSALIRESVELIGTRREVAESFADRYDDYLLADARYLQMFHAGRHAMSLHLAEPGSADRRLEAALVEWNRPRPKQEDTGPVTVLFTDIVGSTDLTQQHGDQAAQQVVHAHNHIVREALTRFAGKEIKHTGDGIMAAFSATSNAVEAAADVQARIRDHNRDAPDPPLAVRIGINAGEPIQEDNDLFGTVVQLAARVCDKAGAGQILVSEVVRGLCAGKGLRFADRGAFDLKGFREPVTLFEAVWDRPPDRPGGADEPDAEASRGAGDSGPPPTDDPAAEETGETGGAGDDADRDDGPPPPDR